MEGLCRKVVFHSRENGGTFVHNTSSKASCKASLMAWAYLVHVLPYLYLEL